MPGVPAVISSNGYGLPVRPVFANAPVMTLASNGFGTPIVISDSGSPFIIEGYDPEDFWDWQEFDLTNGDGGQWVGYSDGGATRPQPAFGSISAQPTSRTALLALYDDTASGVVLAVFAGNYVSQLEGLQISIGGFVLESFEVELISGNTWVRFDDMPGVWTPGDVYQVLFGFDLIQGPFPITNSILGAGGLDYVLYDSSALDRMWQESTGQTPAVLASPVGLIVGREKQAAKTFAQVMAGQPELRGGVTTGSAGTPPAPATYNPTIGDGTFSRTDIANQSYLRINGLTIGRCYEISFLVGAGPAVSLRTANFNTGVFASANSGQTLKVEFIATATNADIAAAGGVSACAISGLTVKEVPAHYASQATAGARPVLQSDGLKFDGSDDNLLTDWFAQSGANCIIAQVNVPSTVVANQVFAGAEVSGVGGFWLGIGTDGRLRGKLGDAGSVSFASIDYRGQTIIAALSANGVTGDGFVQEASYPITGSGAINTVQAWRAGALQNNGVPAGFFGGSIKRLAFGKVAPTLAQFQQIRAEWLAAV